MLPRYKICAFWLAAALFCALPLAACSIISPPAQVQKIIVLNTPDANSPLCTQRLALQILVPMPASSAGLGTDRIAVLLNEREISYLSGYKWEEHAARIVQEHFIDALNGSGCYIGAGSDAMALNAAYRLQLDIKRLHFGYFDNPKQLSAEVEILLRLIDTRSGLMLGQFKAYARQGGGRDEIFSGMEQALHAAIEQSTEWLHQLLTKHAAAATADSAR